MEHAITLLLNDKDEVTKIYSVRGDFEREIEVDFKSEKFNEQTIREFIKAYKAN